MAKKLFSLRLPEEFIELLDSICRKLNVSKTRYIYERCLSPEIIHYEKKPFENETKKELSSLANNMNQVARSFNEIRKMVAEKDCIEPAFISLCLNDVSKKLDVVKEQMTLIKAALLEREKEALRLVGTRKLNQDIIEYLEIHDPEYLKELSKRNGQ